MAPVNNDWTVIAVIPQTENAALADAKAGAGGFAGTIPLARQPGSASLCATVPEAIGAQRCGV